MRIVLVTYGTEGDTRPLIAVAAGLQQRGHRAVVVAEASGAGTAAAHGIEFVPLAGDLVAMMRGDGAVGRTMRTGRFTTGLRAIQALWAHHAHQWVGTLAEVCTGADLVAGSSLAGNVAHAVARALDIRAATLLLQPTRPTRAFCLAAPSLPPGPANRAVMTALLQGGWWAVRPLLHRALRARGLPVVPIDWWQVPVLNGFSPTLVPRPDDWPGFDHICGDWPLPTPDWVPPDDLADFLAAGPPPVYVGFGSMAGHDGGQLLRVILEGVGTRRTLLAPGWSGVATAGLPPHVHVAGHTPHEWLFPRCTAVVHHCGAGTTHAAARAGVPQVPVPLVADQPFWARRLRALGVAGPRLRRAGLGPEALDRALAAVTTPSVRARAGQVAAAMSGEDGVDDVCRRLVGA